MRTPRVLRLPRESILSAWTLAEPPEPLRGAARSKNLAAPNVHEYLLYVPNADEVSRTALEAGAESLHAPVGQPHGDREASVKDLAGNHRRVRTSLDSVRVPCPR
jgi:hypothetical protein